MRFSSDKIPFLLRRSNFLHDFGGSLFLLSNHFFFALTQLIHFPDYSNNFHFRFSFVKLWAGFLKNVYKFYKIRAMSYTFVSFYIISYFSICHSFSKEYLGYFTFFFKPLFISLTFFLYRFTILY